MKKKWYILGACSFIIALAIFVFTYILFHYIGVDGTFVQEFQTVPGKPFITLLFGVWGVLFLFASVMSFLVGKIFYTGNNSDKQR